MSGFWRGDTALVATCRQHDPAPWHRGRCGIVGTVGYRDDSTALKIQLEVHERETGDLQFELNGLREREGQLRRTIARKRLRLKFLRAGRWFVGRRRSRFLIWSVVILVLIGGALGYALSLRQINRPDTTRLGLAQLAPLAPHLLITSEPASAAVFIDDAARGHTPLLSRSPRSTGSFPMRVQAEGHEPLIRTLTVTPRGGAHWHAVLDGKETQHSGATRPGGAAR